jgi:hypothetical protein
LKMQSQNSNGPYTAQINFWRSSYSTCRFSSINILFFSRFESILRIMVVELYKLIRIFRDQHTIENTT